MVTSREFLDVCEGRGVRVHYDELREVMSKFGLHFKRKWNSALGTWVVAYLDAGDIRTLIDHFRVDLYLNPRLFKSNSRG